DRKGHRPHSRGLAHSPGERMSIASTSSQTGGHFQSKSNKRVQCRRISPAVVLAAAAASVPLAFTATRAKADITGFGHGSLYGLNGSATFQPGTGTNSLLQLTDGGLGEAGSTFFLNKQAVNNFTATFTYQDVSI